MVAEVNSDVVWTKSVFYPQQAQNLVTQSWQHIKYTAESDSSQRHITSHYII